MGQLRIDWTCICGSKETSYQEIGDNEQFEKAFSYCSECGKEYEHQNGNAIMTDQQIIETLATNRKPMTHWVDTYPHKVYASVLLLDGKIYNYKIGQSFWENPLEVKMRYSDFEKIDRMTVEHTCFEVNNSEEHNTAFKVLAMDWFKNWEIHELHVGSRCY